MQRWERVYKPFAPCTVSKSPFFSSLSSRTTTFTTSTTSTRMLVSNTCTLLFPLLPHALNSPVRSPQVDSGYLAACYNNDIRVAPDPDVMTLLDLLATDETIPEYPWEFTYNNAMLRASEETKVMRKTAAREARENIVTNCRTSERSSSGGLVEMGSHRVTVRKVGT